MLKTEKRYAVVPDPAQLRAFKNGRESFVDLTQLATVTGVSIDELTKLARSGAIHSVDLDGQILATADAVDRYKAKRSA